MNLFIFYFRGAAYLLFIRRKGSPCLGSLEPSSN